MGENTNVSEWVAIGVALIGSALTAVYSFGYNGRRLDDQEESLGEMKTRVNDLDQAILNHEEDDHKHFQNTDVHWNARERDELRRTLERLENGMATLLERSARRRMGDE